MKLIRVFILFIFVSLIAVNYGCTVETTPGLVRDMQEEFITAIDFDSWQSESLRISPDSKTVAYTRNIGNQQAVIVNGEQQKLYDEVNGYYLVYSGNSEHMAYPARIGEDWYMVFDSSEEGPYEELAFIYIPLFNTDGSRLVYQVKKEEKFYVVIDGQENGPYDEVKYVDMVFSPDGERYAYAAKTGDMWSLMSDGEEIGQYQEINSLLFSPDSRHLAFSGAKDNMGVIVYDKTELGAYEEVSSPIFSPDSNQLTYVYRNGNELFLVLDGQQSKAYVDIDSPVFSPDSKKFAYKAQLANGNWVMVINGVESEEQVFVGVATFSPDSQRLAYMVHDGEHASVILDGEAGPKFKDIGYTSILFSPDSSRVAYLALISGVPEVHEHADEEAADHEHADEELGRYVVIVDGIPGREWNGIGEESMVGRSSIIFSPDSKNYAYFAIDDNWKYVVVNNGKASQPYEDIGSVLSFTPDSQALLYIAYMEDGLHMFVNDDSGPIREAILTLYGGEINFEADNAFSYLIFQEEKIFNVEETLISP